MMKVISLVLLLPISSQLAQAQTTLNGTVHDGAGRPIPFATVALLNARDSSLAKGSASDQQGLYSFTNVRAGHYIVRATAVGYQKRHSNVVEVTNRPTDVAPLMLPEITGKLAEVQVLAKKPFVEQQLDRMVVNVAGSIVGSGSTALEVLEKLPGVTVDYQHERLQLRGKDGVIVQIDGKQTYLSAQDVVALLRTMSSDNIATIELITNPGARYDAAGNSGIINIRLRKNADLGTNGTLTLAGGSGRYDRERGSLQLNHRSQKLNLFGSYSLNRSGTYWDFTFNRNQPDPSPDDASRRNIVTATTYQITRDLGQNAKAGFDFSPTKQTTLGAVWTGFWSDHRSDTDLPANASFRRQDNLPAYYQIQTDKKEKTISQNQVINLNGQHLFGEKGTKGQLSADVDYGQFNSDFTNSLLTRTLMSIESPAKPAQVLITTQPTTVDIRTAKIDFIRTLPIGWKLETGLKWASVKTDNDLALRTGPLEQVQSDPLLSNRFQYTERVGGAYASLSGKLGRGTGPKTEVQLGLRAEHTQSEGRSLTLNQVVPRTYFNLFPSLFVTRALAKGQTISLSYSYRIDRPNYQILNPARSFVDPYSYRKGNAFLKPQYTSAVELRYGLKSGLFVSAGANFTIDLVNPIVYGTGGNASYIIWQNAGNAQGYMLTAGWPLTLMKGWQLQTTLLGYYNQFQVDYEGQAVRVSNVAGRINGNNAFTLGRGWTAELTGWIKTPAVQVLDRSPWLGSLDLGLQRAVSPVLKLKLSVQDVFHSNRFASAMSVPGKFSSDGSFYMDTRVLLVNLTYSFGNQKVKAVRQRRSGSDDETRRAN
ncbi:outer membrane beta-barrel family protein [Spirosoma harenae]